MNRVAKILGTKLQQVHVVEITTSFVTVDKKKRGEREKEMLKRTPVWCSG